MAFTKRLNITWNQPLELTAEQISTRNTFLESMIAAGKTDSTWIGDSVSTQRDFLDQSAVDEYLTALPTWNPGRTLVSNTVTDI